MEIEIDQSRTDVFDGGKAHIEVARRDEPLQQFLRHQRTGLMVTREAPQHVGLFEPMLVKLRWQFEKIYGDTEASYLRISDGREQAVQGMAKFVEQLARIREAQQRRLAVEGLGKIANIDDQGP